MASTVMVCSLLGCGLACDAVVLAMGAQVKISEILAREGSDKTTAHSYGPTYDELFIPYRDTARVICEVGVYGGASVRAWHEFFSRAIIFGVDLEIRPCADTRLPPNRYIGIAADSRKPETLALASTFDIVIDDGCHEPLVQVATFAALYRMVNPGGLYVIEDVQRIEDAVTIAGTFGGKVIDLRAVKDREDDILIVFRAKTP